MTQSSLLFVNKGTGGKPFSSLSAIIYSCLEKRGIGSCINLATPRWSYVLRVHVLVIAIQLYASFSAISIRD